MAQPKNDQSFFGIQLQMLPPFVKNISASGLWFPNAPVKFYYLTLVIEDIDHRFRGLISLDSFSNIRNNEYLNVRKALYDWQGPSIDRAPERLFLITSVVKCKAKLKDPGSVLENAKLDPVYLQLVNHLTSTISETATFPSVVNAALKIIAAVKKHLGKVDDSLSAVTARYFNKQHGDMDNPGYIPLQVSTQNVDFSFKLLVYNQELSLDVIEGAEIYLGENITCTASQNIYPL
jgi:hypothetical protein